MALRSGYKGYKKLAEGLKEFWPGILGADIPALKKTFLDWSSYAKTGAVNLCLPTSANSGIVTRNSDNTFTVNGTLSEATVYELGRDCFPTLEIGTIYKLVGCPSSGIPNGTNLAIRPVSTSTGAKSESGNGVTWEVTNATTASAFSYLYLAAGTYDNVVFKPMLTPRLDATYADYVKGAMTNEELTKAVAPVPFLDMSKTVYSSGTYSDLNDVKKSGIYSVFYSALNKPSDITGSLNNATLIVTANPVNASITQTLIDGDHKALYIRFTSDGSSWGSWSKFTGTPVE